MKYRCVIFDFDGTLADSEECALKIYNSLAKKYGYKPLDKDEVINLKGLSVHEILSRLKIGYYQTFRLLRRGKKLIKQYLNEIRPFEENIGEVLQKVSENCEIMGIISSNKKRNIKFFLNKYNINIFDFILSSPLFKKERKLRKIKKKYNLKDNEILYVGDEMRDIISSKNANIDICSVNWGYNSHNYLLTGKPTYVIENLDCLIEILK